MSTTLPQTHWHNCACHISAPCSACFDCKHWDEPECDNDCQECDVDHSQKERVMSFEYTDIEGGTFSLDADGRHGTVSAISTRESIRIAVFIPKVDAPTVAVELLRAAGHDKLADLVAREAAEKKLQERRDALAVDFSESQHDYFTASPMTRRAIDRIIELEDADEAAK